MSDNRFIRNQLSAIIAEIEYLKLALGTRYLPEPSDREALEIIRRIERKLAWRQHDHLRENPDYPPQGKP